MLAWKYKDVHACKDKLEQFKVTYNFNCRLRYCSPGDFILLPMEYDHFMHHVSKYLMSAARPCRLSESYSWCTSRYCMFGMKKCEQDWAPCNVFPVRNIWTSLYPYIDLIRVYFWAKFKHTKLRRGRSSRGPHYRVLIFG